MIQEPGADNGLYRRLILLALPIMAANLLQTLYNLADTFFLGRLGKEAVSAPSIAFNMIFFLVVFGTGFSSAGTTLISQAKGRGDDQKVDFYVGQTFSILLLVSTMIMITGLLLTDTLLDLLQVPSGLPMTIPASICRSSSSACPGCSSPLPSGLSCRGSETA